MWLKIHTHNMIVLLLRLSARKVTIRSLQCFHSQVSVHQSNHSKNTVAVLRWFFVIKNSKNTAKQQLSGGRHNWFSTLNVSPATTRPSNGRWQDEDEAEKGEEGWGPHHQQQRSFATEARWHIASASGSMHSLSVTTVVGRSTKPIDVAGRWRCAVVIGTRLLSPEASRVKKHHQSPHQLACLRHNAGHQHPPGDEGTQVFVSSEALNCHTAAAAAAAAVIKTLDVSCHNHP